MILLVLGFTALCFVVVVGMAPGRIAKTRNHPQAEAVSVCGWMGVLTLGILLPLAFIWAYYRPAVGVGPLAREFPVDGEE